MRFFHRHKKRLRKKDHCMYRKFAKRILGTILSGCGTEALPAPEVTVNTRRGVYVTYEPAQNE